MMRLFSSRRESITADLRVRARAFASAKLAERQNQAGAELNPVRWPRSGGSPLLQPPKPQIRPSARVLERGSERAADMEAAI